MAEPARPARYLLRIDDLCPTVDSERWARLRKVIERSGVRPILAAVPDNQDAELMQSPADPDFWQQMREMQAAGSAIGLHGYQHLCTRPAKRGLLPLHRTSEFAGAPREAQSAWIAQGLRILRDHGLRPRLWIAPRHGFDRNTLDALVEHDIRYLSDGFAHLPFKRGGVTWLPMQLWEPVRREKGLWTICVHPNSIEPAKLIQLEQFLRDFGSQFTSFDRVIGEFSAERLGPLEWLHATVAMQRIVLRRRIRQPGVSLGSE